MNSPLTSIIESAIRDALDTLDLHGLRLTELPPLPSELLSLRRLDLSGNRLQAVPDQVFRLTQLEELNLANNGIAQLDPKIGTLHALRFLDLSENRLSTLPSELAGCKRLETLSLFDNQISTLPPVILELPALRSLDLARNRLEELPDLHSLANLEVLDLSHNQLTSLDVPALPASLQRFFVDDNQLPEFRAPLDEIENVSRGTTVEKTREFVERVLRRVPDGRRIGRGDQHRSFEVVEETPKPQPRPIPEVAPEPRPRPLPELAPGRPPATTRPPYPADEPEQNSDEANVTKLIQAIVPPATRESDAAAPSIADAEPVDAAVFCPPEVVRNSVFLLQVFLYPPRAASEVDRQAQQADETAERRGTYSLPLDLPRGTRVDLHLEIPALKVAEPDVVLLWRGTITGGQFEVEVPNDVAAAQVIGRVRIAVDRVPAGTLRFQLGVVAAGTTPGTPEAREVRVRRYRRAFVSYSSKDRAEVLRRVQAFKILGLSVFQDILELDPGERWEKRLYQEIDTCDVFMLFWSSSAAASEWVLKEIDYAVTRKQGDDERPPAIQPVPIEGPPIVPPPPSLKDLHFNDSLLAQIQAADGIP